MSIEQVLQQASGFIAAQQWEQAGSVLKAQLEQGPVDARIHEALGIIAGQQQDHALAAQHFDAATLADPSQASHFHNLGEALRQLLRFDEAQAALQQAMRLQPSMVQAYESLIQIAYVGYGHALAAQDESRKAFIEYELATLYNHLGNALLGLGGQEQALAAYRQAHLYAPRHASVLSNLGNVLCMAGQVSEAELMCRSAIAENPDLPQYCSFRLNRDTNASIYKDAFSAQSREELDHKAVFSRLSC